MQVLADRATVEIEGGLAYREGVPVIVRVTRRANRVDVDDGGAAVELAGRRRGWLEAAADAVGRHGVNVNRRGLVFVPAHEGRDLDALASTVAQASREVFLALLDLGH